MDSEDVNISFEPTTPGNHNSTQRSQGSKPSNTTNRLREHKQTNEESADSPFDTELKTRVSFNENSDDEHSKTQTGNDDIQNYEDVVTLHVPHKDTIWLNTKGAQSRFSRLFRRFREPKFTVDDPLEATSLNGSSTYDNNPNEPTTGYSYLNPGMNGNANSNCPWDQNDPSSSPGDSDEDRMVWTTNFLAALSIVLIVLTFPFSLVYCIRIVAEYERAVVLRMGNLIPKGRGTKGPGLFFILPCIDSVRKVDLRTVTFAIPPQELLTRDSVTVSVDAVVYYRVLNPVASVLNIEDAARSTRLLAQTTIRNVLGTKDLAQILMDRDEISTLMQSNLDATTDAWGVKVERVEIKDVRLPIQLQRAMAAEAEAAREARAKVIAAHGEREAARSLKKAARIISTSPMAFQLRYLQTLCAISAEKNSTIFFPVPIDIMQNLGNFTTGSIASGLPGWTTTATKHSSTNKLTTTDIREDLDTNLMVQSVGDTSFGQEDADTHSDTV